MTRLRNTLSLLLLGSFLLFFSACEEGSVDPDAGPLQEREVAALLEADLQHNTGGINSNLEDLIAYLIQVGLSGELCDTLFTETIDESYQGLLIQSTYMSALSFEMDCGLLNIPKSAAVTASTDFTFTSQKIRSENTSTFMGNISGLHLLSDTLTVDGSFTQEGSQEMNFFVPRSISSVLITNMSELKVRKSPFEILEGSLSFDLSGSTRNNGNFSFSGSLEFFGNRTGTLSLNGSNFPLDWNP